MQRVVVINNGGGEVGDGVVQVGLKNRGSSTEVLDEEVNDLVASRAGSFFFFSFCLCFFEGLMVVVWWAWGLSRAIVLSGKRGAVVGVHGFVVMVVGSVVASGGK
eukprot:2974751-Heterocapsa_arctica.AAC.1